MSYPPLPTKRCLSCEEVKGRDDFWRDPRKKSGLHSECKACARMRNAQWQQNNWKKLTAAGKERSNKKRLRDPRKAVFKSVRDRARARGMEFNLEINNFEIPLLCPILGIPLKSNMGANRGQGLKIKDASPSVDRIDNSRGYTKDNIVIVSYRANRIKSDATIEELRRIVEFYDRIAGRDSHAA